ncbi:hypothetical protein GCM10009850_115460 [Nonomuraea monospora]|uniref:Transposase n=1 Tax=Nonomuraea monospora TaxID=568818 RepID=A0ABN3D3C3_9ACTN
MVIVQVSAALITQIAYVGLGWHSPTAGSHQRRIPVFRALNEMSDRLLSRLLPTTTAEAEPCWWTSTGIRCCIYAGKTYCR